MAPRKRPTKQGKKTPKMVKLEAFLDDFDSEVKTRLGQLQERKNQMLRDLRNSYNVALIKLPANVRKMTWMEHFKVEKLKSPEADDAKRQEEAAIVENVVAEDHAVLMKAVKKMSKKKAATKSSPNDENTPRTLRKGKTSRKPPTTSKRARALSVSQQNAPITRSSRNPVVTPARTLLDSSLMGPTPLITPRFDPRLPKTPAVRVPRHKERVFSISVNGSPISADNEEIVINVPVGNGESIQLLASQVDSVDLSMLGETALRSIRRLQNRLTSLCES
ncbi:borealin [Hippocampus comes]|uniref:Cell division cycle associated 8 n=1 Tax=Hippocampus comes TaxID=109280 RepID=A0A3Q2YYT4_HIPCM|nr:PREDICTED: borealin [Hippocampus comes]XP_019738839.1 PREDICTED: borealin [Hippocampus comes]